jgi:hypothetical protein
MPVPNTFANATTSIPLSQLDTNFATAITLGNTAIQLGNTVSTLNNMTLANVTISSGTVSVANATVTGNVTMSGGNLSFTSTGQRITGDFSNATIANRLIVQTTTTNGGTTFSAIPNGTSQVGSFVAFNNSDPTNGSTVQMVVTSSESRFSAGAAGTGTYLPMTFYSNNAERMRLDTSGNLGIGTSSPSALLHVNGNSKFGALVTTGLGVSTGDVGIEVGGERSGNGNSIIDLHATAGADFSARLLRISGANGQFEITNSGTGALVFATNSAERMRIDSSGNVGIGTSSPAARMDVRGTIYAANTASAYVALNHDGTNGSITNNTGFMLFYANGANPILWHTNGAERARIDSSGNLLVGTTSYNYSFTGDAVQIGSAGNTVILSKNTTANTNMIVFNNPNGQVGYINTSGSATTYSTSSDYRLKRNVQPMITGLATITALKPVTYEWKIDSEKGEGFIAHELQAIIPQAVSGEKDAVNDDGSIKPQGVDYSKIVVHLVAAIQELKAEFDAYKAAHP